jgi:hypothetical protein
MWLLAYSSVECFRERGMRMVSECRSQPSLGIYSSSFSAHEFWHILAALHLFITSNHVESLLPKTYLRSSICSYLLKSRCHPRRMTISSMWKKPSTTRRYTPVLMDVLSSLGPVVLVHVLTLKCLAVLEWTVISSSFLHLLRQIFLIVSIV